jgi:hypothetical protein
MGQAGIFPSPGRVSSTVVVDGAGAGPAVVGGSVPATVVGVVEGGEVLVPRLVEGRRGTVRVTGVVVAGAADVGGWVTGPVVTGPSVVGVVTTWPAARPVRGTATSAPKTQRPTTASARRRSPSTLELGIGVGDTSRCLLVRRERTRLAPRVAG